MRSSERFTNIPNKTFIPARLQIFAYSVMIRRLFNFKSNFSYFSFCFFQNENPIFKPPVTKFDNPMCDANIAEKEKVEF